MFKRAKKKETDFFQNHNEIQNVEKLHEGLFSKESLVILKKKIMDANQQIWKTIIMILEIIKYLTFTEKQYLVCKSRESKFNLV